MQHVAGKWDRDAADPEWVAALPLYLASLVVTLAGVGAVGVTVATPSWIGIWAMLTVMGHGVSLLLRALRVPAEVVFYPVMLLGCAVVFQLYLAGSPAVGMDGGLAALPTDMATATIVSAVAVVRTFTLLTNGSLLFSPVPAITMLALVGSSNPNAEVPLFFGLLVLGSLFLSGYESFLRRTAPERRPTGLITFHLLTAWGLTLAAMGAALLFPAALQPVIGPLSPFALPAVSRLRALAPFPQVQAQQTSVGQGPILLTPTPVYEVYSSEGGRMRTHVFTNYTGRSWVPEPQPNVIDIHSVVRVPAAPVPSPEGDATYRANHYLFRFRGDPDLARDIPTHEVRARIVTRSTGPEGIPALGTIVELRYPRAYVYLHGSGTVSANGHQGSGKSFEVASRVPAFEPERLRKSAPIDPDTFDQPEALALPQSAFPVQALAEQITSGISNPYERVQAILHYIEKNCRYTLLEDVTPAGEDAAAHYLFKSRRGACDLSATAAAVMCRAVGIPARVAVGYFAAEPLPQGGGFLVRQEHAHMWLEAYFAGAGWAPFDPAPPLATIHDRPLEMLWYRTRQLFSHIGGGGLDALLLVIVVTLTLALAGYHGWLRLRVWLREAQRARRALHGPAAAATAHLYARALRVLERRGWTREAWMTPREYLAWLRPQWAEAPEALAALAALTDRYQRAHYGGEESEDLLQGTADALRALEARAPRRPRPDRKLRPAEGVT